MVELNVTETSSDGPSTPSIDLHSLFFFSPCATKTSIADRPVVCALLPHRPTVPSTAHCALTALIDCHTKKRRAADGGSPVGSRAVCSTGVTSARLGGVVVSMQQQTHTPHAPFITSHRPPCLVACLFCRLCAESRRGPRLPTQRTRPECVLLSLCTHARRDPHTRSSWGTRFAHTHTHSPTSSCGASRAEAGRHAGRHGNAASTDGWPRVAVRCMSVVVQPVRGRGQSQGKAEVEMRGEHGSDLNHIT